MLLLFEMVDPKQYIKQGLKIIENLVKQGNLVSAVNGCKDLLRINPYDKSVLKQQEKIEALIEKENIKKVDMDIDRTMHLWQEKRFEELRDIYVRLYSFAPEYGRLRKLISQLNERLSEDDKNNRKLFIEKALKAISDLMDSQKYGDVIQASNELLNMDPLNEDAKQSLQKAKNSLIEQKLRDNQNIFDSADFERALDFFESLLKIDPNNKKVKQLVLQAQERVAHQKLLAAKIHLNESIARMKDLFKAAEYEKVIQSCEEIDRLDPGNFTARVFKKKAASTIESEINTQAVKRMKEAMASEEAAFRKNPSVFLKV